MSNKFDENTWDAEQCVIDQRVLSEFSALETAYAAAEAAGVSPAAFAVDNDEKAQGVVALIGELTHEGRREHWHAELARLGFVPALAPVASEPEPEVVAPLFVDEPTPRNKRGGR